MYIFSVRNGYNNTARLNLKIDRFQVNNEYSRDGMRTEQIHIEKLVKLCARKNTIQLKVENIENVNNTHIKQKKNNKKTIVLLNVSKFCHNGVVV